MDLFSLLTLLCLAEVVCTGTHSLWYFATLTAGPSPFPEMVIVGMVDDVPVQYYDSAERTLTSRQDWYKEDGNVSYVQMKRLAIAHTAHSLKNKLHHMMEQFNHSVLSPRIRLLRKQVGGAGDVQVTCMATGFYPRHIELTLKRDKQPVPEQELIGGDVLPNGDGTYQLRISLSVSAEETIEGHRYSCSVKHVSMDNKLDIAWELQPKPDIALISGASVAALSIVLLIVTGIFILKKRKSKDPGSSKSGKNKGEVERLNAAEGEAREAGGGAEMERQDE